jgi:predicted HAD superfamily Cof-like phosphohydrolase
MKGEFQVNIKKTNYEQVEEFHEAFGVLMPSSPTPLSLDALVTRMSFSAEEMIEALHGTSYSEAEFYDAYLSLLKRMNSTYIKQMDKKYPETQEEVLINQVDALTDLRYFNNGDFTLIKVEPDPIFSIVHNANMGKLHEDGKPRYNEVGKIIKPDNWVKDFAPEPLIKKEIQRQIEAAQQ